MDIEVLDANPLYMNKIFRLKFAFSDSYPIGLSITPFSSEQATDKAEPPEVTFTKLTIPPRPIPLHPHVYSNGYICLDLLGSSGWSPVQNVISVCMSIQSMLTGNTKAEAPEGDENFVRTNTRRPRDVAFLYHEEV